MIRRQVWAVIRVRLPLIHPEQRKNIVLKVSPACATRLLDVRVVTTGVRPCRTWFHTQSKTRDTRYKTHRPSHARDRQETAKDGRKAGRQTDRYEQHWYSSLIRSIRKKALYMAMPQHLVRPLWVITREKKLPIFFFFGVRSHWPFVLPHHGKEPPIPFADITHDTLLQLNPALCMPPRLAVSSALPLVLSCPCVLHTGSHPLGWYPRL